MGEDGYEPFWGEPDATIDFCEKNYQYFSFICEPFGAFSNIFYVIVGLYCLFIARRISYRIGLNYIPFTFYLQNLIVVIIGIGSFLFHSTLRRYFQLCDEIPMEIGLLIIVYSLVEIQWMGWWIKGNKLLFLRIGLGVASILLIGIYLFFPYWVFVAVFIGCAFLIVLPLEIYFFFKYIKTKETRIAGILSWICSIPALMFWFSDVLFCEYVEILKLHVFWHFFTAAWCFYQLHLAIWLYYFTAEMHRERPAYSFEFKLFLFFFPYIAVKEFVGP